MKLVHLLYPDETGCIYCKKINGLIKIVEMRTPCLQCEKWWGTIQGEGCECEWDDFDFDAAPSVYDHVAEYDRVNTFKAVSRKERLAIWRKKNIAAKSRSNQDMSEDEMLDMGMPVQVYISMSEEQSKRENCARCLSAFPDSCRIYLREMDAVPANLCIERETGWEKALSLKKADFPRLISLWYPDGVDWNWEQALDKIDGDIVWIIGFGD